MRNPEAAQPCVNEEEIKGERAAERGELGRGRGGGEEDGEAGRAMMK